MRFFQDNKQPFYNYKGALSIFLIVLVSFIMCMVVSMWSLYELAKSNTREVNSVLTSRIYDIINTSASEPVIVSKTMVAEPTLVEALENEDNMSEEEAINNMRYYLAHFKAGLDYDAAFVVSEKTKRYYTYKGLNKIVDPINDSHDVWYTDFLATGKQYILNIDNDEAEHNRLTVFVNTRVEDSNGKLLGVCGVGVSLVDFQKLFAELEDKYSVRINLVDKTGQVKVDVHDENIEYVYLDIDSLRSSDEQEYAISTDSEGNIIITKYIEQLGWYLVVRTVSGVHDSNLNDVLRLNFLLFLLVMIIIMSMLGLIVKRSLRKTHVAKRLNEQLASTSKLYSVVRDIDVINNTYTDIKSFETKNDDPDVVEHNDAQDFLVKEMHKYVDASYHDRINDFLDFTHLDESMDGHNAVTTEFLSITGHWHRGRLVVSQYTPLKKISRILWLVEDIDEEKNAREQLRNISEQAIAANNAKSAFLSHMSHEIRTPINAMLGMNEMILRESNDNEQILSYAQNINVAGHTLLALVNDILDFSKIEAGKMEIIPVEYDLSSVINDMVQMIKFRAAEKGLAVSVDIDPDTPKLLRGDDIRIKQVITNLLTNSVKYTKTGNIVLIIEHKKIAEDRVLLEVSVKDTGVGIKKEDMEKLFTEFERLEEDKNRSIEGTGLGLSITINLLKLMGSRLEVESIYGLGSRFYFTLEQKVIKWEAIGNFSNTDMMSGYEYEPNREKFTAPEAEILVVDDNEMNLFVFCNLLKRNMVKIDKAQSGDEALQYTQKKKYDIIFLDHMMPNKDGIETLHEIRKQDNGANLDTPVICLTANAISGVRESYIKEGFNNYLSKPIDTNKLEDMLLKFLPKDKIH
ncbi:MAG: response regulator [Anaerovibrio sp.]|uniref:hybrid sensor histidine kinase/response regulator n=1 Tax=Anaerovibrio sp. TaxID=1872532 RepID=UPI0025FCAABC|nr:hybrid sensor histidine kinase/response regulator [Anaerovibrio sp.]MCR5177187.1 response regulator [Anaerovibrio sp.]